jgi:hypothetical protein
MANLIMTTKLAEPVVCPLRDLRRWLGSKYNPLRFLLKLACIKTVIMDAL